MTGSGTIGGASGVDRLHSFLSSSSSSSSFLSSNTDAQGRSLFRHIRWTAEPDRNRIFFYNSVYYEKYDSYLYRKTSFCLHCIDAIDRLM